MEATMTGTESKTGPALLVDARQAAELLGIGRTHLFGLLSSGRLPAPVRLGRAVRWRRAELEQWIAAGCPSAERWEILRQAAR